MTEQVITIRDPLISREMVVATAVRVVEEHDIAALTMRRLANELGTAVTAVYHHVGNRDALLDLMVDQLIADMRPVRVVGRTPAARIASLCRGGRKRLQEHPHLIAIANERGKIPAMFQPLIAALAGELAAVGLCGRAAAPVVRALQFHVISSVVVEATITRHANPGGTAGATDPAVWADGPGDRKLITALAEPVDYQTVFETGLNALLAGLLP